MIQKKQKIKIFIRRVRFEIKSFLLNLIYKCKWLCFSLINLPKHRLIRKKNKVLYVWDSRTNSITFDFIANLYEIFRESINLGFSKFDLIIYLPDENKLKPFEFRKYNHFVSSKDLYKRIDNLIIPLAKSCKCVNSIKKITSRNFLLKEISLPNQILLPYNYHINFSYDFKNQKKHFKNCKNESKPIKFPGLSLNKSFHEVFDEIQLKENGFVDGKKEYITLTLRDYGFSPLRNTDSQDIEIANEFARKKNCKLVIIPDSLDNIHKYSIPENIKISTLARLFIQERIALYQNSIVNLFSNSGPVDVSSFIHGAKTILFKHGNGDPNDPLCDCSPLHFKRIHNINVGDQPFLAFDTYYLWHNPKEPYTVSDLEMAFDILENN